MVPSAPESLSLTSPFLRLSATGQAWAAQPGGATFSHRGMTKVEVSVMGIDKLWDRLDPETRQWLVDNPGCMILPRTVAAAISKATGAEFDQDRHGETTLSPSDCDFIRKAAELQGAESSKSS